MLTNAAYREPTTILHKEPRVTTRRIRHVALCLAVLLTGCGGNSPTAPTPPAPRTRTIGLSGNLAFGEVLVGSSSTAVLMISNTGTGPLTVSGMNGPSGFSTSWSSGVIPAGASQQVTIGFQPTVEGDYGGTITVVADHTSGNNTIATSGSAFPNMNGAWSGVQTISGQGQSGVCNQSWIVSGQTGSQFSGTWQSSGPSCGQAGTLSGTVTTSRAVSGLRLVATVGPSQCTRIGGDGLLNGVLSGSALTVQATDTVQCPGTRPVDRSITLAMRKQ